NWTGDSVVDLDEWCRDLVKVQVTILAKLLLSLGSRKIKNQWEKRCICKRLEAIPSCAIRCGSFYNIERNTTPVFCDFVVNQVVGLLLAF
ncbi:unnamed protein product, partial [Allacma fusca]